MAGIRDHRGPYPPDSEEEDAFAPSSSARKNGKSPANNGKVSLRPTTATTGASTDSETESDDDDADFDDPFVGIDRPVHHYRPKLSTEPHS